jgi:hypothetical protein
MVSQALDHAGEARQGQGVTYNEEKFNKFDTWMTALISGHRKAVTGVRRSGVYVWNLVFFVADAPIH